MVLKEGKKAPDFALNDWKGDVFKLYDSTSNYTIVYFYPKDSTPGCTIEANEFSGVLSEFKKLGVAVIGISGGDEKSKKKFCEKNELHVTLLSDQEFKVCNNYKVYGEKKFMGRKYQGIFRVTYVLDNDKKILKIYDNVSATGHAQEVLDYIKGLS